MKQFIVLYDKAPIFSLKGMNIVEQYQALGIEDKMSHTTSRVEDVLKDRILNPITAKGESKVPRKEIEKLKNVFCYCKILEHTDRYESCYIALNCIFSIGGNNIEDYVPLSEEKQWMEALSYLKGYMELHLQNDPFRDDFRQKELDRARAAVRLSKIGLRVEIENNDLKFDKEYMVTSQLSNWISQIGGVRFVEALLNLLPYDQRKGRLMLVRQGNLPNLGAFVPEYPFGFLLNLGLRHTSSIGSEKALKKHFGNVMNLSRDFCLAVYPYQSYSIWEKVLHRNETVLEYFQRLTLMDSLYYMQQSGKDFVLEMCNFLIDQMVQSGMSLNVDCTFEEYQQLMNILVGRTDIKKFIRLKQTEIDVLQDKKRQAEILKILCLEMGAVNINYEKPLDYNKVNYNDRPFVMLKNGDVILYPTTIGVWGWYEMLMSLLRLSDSQIDNKVGLMLEELMHNKLHQKGIATKTGRYVVDKIEGEADVVIEIPDKILLIEMKKKTITRSARQGQIYQIVLDFAGSLLYSQEQCVRTDTLLRRKGSIDLLKKKKLVDTLEWLDRESDKITLTLSDYGTLQDRAVLRNVLDEMLKYRFTIDEKEVREFETDEKKQELIIKGYKTLAEKQNDMITYLTELKQQHDSAKTWSPFFNSFFFNMEQMFFMVGLANSLDELCDMIDAHRTPVMGTFDFWQEFDWKMQMHEGVKKCSKK